MTWKPLDLNFPITLGLGKNALRNLKSSPRDVFLKTDFWLVLEVSEKHVQWSSLLIKSPTFILQFYSSSQYFSEMFRTSFFKKTSGWLLLEFDITKKEKKKNKN